MKLTEILLQRIKELDIKQIHIAKELNVSTSSVSSWVRGLCEPNGAELPKLLKMLNLSIIDGDILKNESAKTIVPLINSSTLHVDNIKSKSKVHATREDNISFIINVDDHNNIFPYGTYIYIKRFNGVKDFVNNMLIVLEADNGFIDLEKLVFVNNIYYDRY